MADLNSLGIKAEKRETPGHPMVVGHVDGDGPHLLFYGHYDVQPGDVGMHVLVAPADKRIPGFTWAVFVQIMDFLFSDERVERVVVEPDVSNDAIHPINRRAGFVYHRQIELPGKTAWFATCTRVDYDAALRDAIAKDSA